MARIYVIDDDEQLLRMVGLMLERGGHAVTLINNPVEGLEQINTNKPDLLVLDVMMPGMSGHDMTRDIRGKKELEDLPILILTARSQDVDREAALKSGADDYLSKPVTSQELMERVDKLLTKGPQEAQPDLHVIIAFYGFRGGVGQTTLAVNLAAALRRLSQQDVCLVDFSLSGSQAVHHMRLQTQASWANVQDADSLDWPTLREYLALHPSGLRVLAAPKLPQTPTALSAEVATKILTLLHDNVLFTVVDLPSVYHPIVKVALSRAYMGLHVITPEVVAVQTAVHTNQILARDEINTKYRSHILNHVTPDAQLTQAAVERGLGVRVAFQVAHDLNQTRALVQGVPLTLTSAQSPISTVVKRMAEAIVQRVAAGK